MVAPASPVGSSPELVGRAEPGREPERRRRGTRTGPGSAAVSSSTTGTRAGAGSRAARSRRSTVHQQLEPLRPRAPAEWRPLRSPPHGLEVDLLERGHDPARRRSARRRHEAPRRARDLVARGARGTAARRTPSRPRRRAARASSAGAPAATIRPARMIATRSQTSSTSLSRWELSSTATTAAAQPSSSSRTMRRPTGSSAPSARRAAAARGAPTSACAIPSRCCMPFDICSTRRSPPRRGRPARAALLARPPRPERANFWCSTRNSSASPAGEAEELGEVAEARA